MEEIIRFKVLDQSGEDTIAELMVNTETDVFEILIAGEIVMSGMWLGDLQKVFQRALYLWNVEKEVKK